jgi:hypothetical protein
MLSKSNALQIELSTFEQPGIKEPMEQSRIAKKKVQNLWQQKKLKLEQCLQLRVFEQDCSQVC